MLVYGRSPIRTRYPFIPEESSRLASKEVTELLHSQPTQEFRQALSQVIESFVSSPGFTWQWHDEFKLSDKIQDQLAEEEERKALENEEVPLADMLDEVKKIIKANPSMDSKVQEILEPAVKVINFHNSANID